MEPLMSYAGLELSLTEFILGAFLFLLGFVVSLIFARRGQGALQDHLSQMRGQQTELQGRLSQMAEASAQRETMLRDTLDTRLSKVSERVGQSITETQARNSANLKQLHERLALIDRAQKNIETLSGEVSGLQTCSLIGNHAGPLAKSKCRTSSRLTCRPMAFLFSKPCPMASAWMP